MKQALKRFLLPAGRALRTIRLGIARGIRMNLDLQSQAQRVFGLDERELFRPLRTLMPRCRSMMDIGANDGYYTLIFLQSKAERVIAVEGGTNVTQRLLENARANGHEPGERFQVINQCAGSSPGHVPLAELVRDLPGPILIKLDVDGGETDVLKSAENSARLGDLCWIIEIHSVELEEQCLEWLRAHGFATRIINNASWRKLLPETRDAPHNRWIMAAPQAWNMSLE